MEIEGCSVHIAKRIVKLEVQCDQLREEKIKLMKQVMEGKGKEQKMIEKCAKGKDKYAKLNMEFGSEKSKWREEEGNLREICSQVGVENKKLKIDLESERRRITNGSVELAQKLMEKDKHFKGLVEEINGTITTLLADNEALNTHNRMLETTFKARMAKGKEEFDSEGRKWREEEEKIKEACRQLNIEKRKLENDLKAAKRGIADDGDSVTEKLKAAEAEVEDLKSLLGEKDGTVTTLLANTETLKRENRKSETEFQAKKRKVEENVLELTRKIEVLEGRTGQMEADYCKLKEDNKNEVEKFFSVNKAFEAEKKRLEKAKKKISEFVKWIGVLERDKEAEKMDMEEEAKKNVSELTQRIEVLEREQTEMEAEYCKLKEDNKNEAENIFNVNKAFEAEKKRLEKAEKKINELIKWIDVLERDNEAEKMAMEEEGKKKVSELTRKIEVLEREQSEMEAKACQAKKEMSEEIERILKAAAISRAGSSDELENKLEVVEAEAEALISFLEGKLSVLTQKIQVVEGEKAQLEAEFRKLKEDSRSEAERICRLNEALETEKKRGKTERKKILELVDRVKEAEKMAMEDEGRKKASDLTCRIEVLEMEKRGLEAKFSLVNKELNEEIKRISNEKMILEAREMTMEADRKKMDLEFVQRIEVLEQEKVGLEAEVFEAKREKSEEINRILNKKIALKEKHTKEIMNLVSRCGVLERENRRLEAETRGKVQRTKVFVQEKQHLEAKKNKMAVEMNRRVVKPEKDVELPLQVHPASSVVVLSAQTTENQGSKIQKRKVQGPGCSEVNQAGAKQCKIER